MVRAKEDFIYVTCWFDKHYFVQDDILDMENLDWAKDVTKTVQKLRNFIEDDSSSVLEFFSVCDLKMSSVPQKTRSCT